jgi:uncharacterized membrane protein
MIMDFTLKNTSLLIAIVLTGLSAGLFYAWSVSVIPGTRKIADATYLETMQQINRAIINPQFIVIFFGSMIMLAISTVQHYGNGASFWILFIATLTYTLGTIAVTGMGNVPLNNELDTLRLSDLTPTQLGDFRSYYELKWNMYHRVRTIFSVLAFVISLIAAFTSSKTFTTY